MDTNEITQRVEKHKLNQRLQWHEEQIKRAAMSVASALKALQDDPLEPWKVKSESFNHYCRDVLHIHPRRLQQLLAAQSVKDVLCSEVPELADQIEAMPEGQIRVLVQTPEPKRVEVLRASLEAGGKLTAPRIKKAKARVLGTALPAPVMGTTPAAADSALCPHCGQRMPRL